MSPSAQPPIAAVTSVSDRRPKTARRVLKDVADKAGLSRNRAHLRFGSFRDQCRAGALASNIVKPQKQQRLQPFTRLGRRPAMRTDTADGVFADAR